MTRIPELPELPEDAEPNPAVHRIGPYRLLRRVAAGGMSSVYQAYDDTAHQTVAVKVLSESLSQKPEFVRRFRREARLTQLLRHEHLVHGLASGYDPATKSHYLAMEFVAGPTSAMVMADGKRLPVPVVVKIGMDIASALSFLHGVQFVHRDVKPENILLDPAGTSKLVDLGLVRKIDGASDLTASNQGVGTPYYMAHEQAQNSSLVDGRSDIFSLGATLYHLATGELPFPGETQEAISAGKESGTFHAAKTICSDLPDDFERILTRMLDRSIRQRYQKSEDVFADLDATKLSASPAQMAHFVESGNYSDIPLADGQSPTRTDLTNALSKPGPTRIGHRAVAVIGLAAVAGVSIWFGEPTINRTIDPCASTCEPPFRCASCQPDTNFESGRQQNLRIQPIRSSKS